MRLTLQQMIDSVLEGAQPGAMAKLAEEADGGEGSKPPQDKGEGDRKDKKDLERKADSEEAQQGGGTPESSQEKTASTRVEKLAAAVEEIVAHLAGLPAPSGVGKVAAEDAASPSVGPGKGPGATQTNLETPVSGDQPMVSGQAKTQIPNSPPMEAGDNPKAAKNALQTNEDMQHPAQPDAGVMKQGSLASFAARLAKQGGAFSEGLGIAGRAVREGAQAEGVGGALRAALGQAELNPQVQKALIAAGAVPVTAGTVAATQAIPDLKVGGPEIFEKKEKNAEDAINPAQISAPKSTGLPEDQPSKMARPAEVTSQERHVASNEAPAATQPVDVAAVPKKRMAEVLDEPMQTASTDKVLDSVLGSSVVNQAGAKIASAQEARAWLAKVASEGCKCGPEKGTCQFCKVASRLGKGQKDSEKRGQLGTPPVGAGGSSPGGALAGGNITPSM